MALSALFSAEPRALADAVTARVNRTSALWQQFGFLCDLITLDPDGTGCHHEELLVDYVAATATGDYVTVTLEYGPDHDRFDPFDISVGRIAQSDAEAAPRAATCTRSCGRTGSERSSQSTT